MNRFRKQKKAKEETTAAARSSEDSEHSSLSGFKGFRKGKKAPVEEPKKEFDLSTALPSDDNFRTSLLMTNLSARFSMLREQDDPNTKIGKASDDSVLYPKRQSRLADFGFGAAGGGLGDIAEVESIKASSHFLRSDSIASADFDNGGSILSRGKPIEGNNLFGGRQKIYKVPAAKSGGLGGRALYADDDVALSAFQRWRISEKEKEQQGHEDEEEHEDQPRSESPPPVGYNRRRETTSTTSSASIMARNSTAANSITSQPAGYVSTAPTSVASTPVIDRSVTHKRRLYEQSTSQDAPEQSSVLSRIESFNRQRTAASGVKALGDRLGEERTLVSKTSAPQLRSVSPPITTPATGTGDSGDGAASQADPKLNFGGSPPLSPPISETGEPHPLLPIQPNDVGKATAMGVFQKPSQPYDETKYAQRQIQLQQGRETPTRRFRAESDASFATARSRESSTHRQPFEARGEPLRTQPAVEEEPASTDLDSKTTESLQAQALAALSGQLSLQRPADEEHPALRAAALPPLSINTSKPENPTISIEESIEPASADSPTLGPNAGLGGLVRSHLRSDSNASSIWGVTPQNNNLEPRPLDMLPEPKITPWIAPEQEWTLAYYGNGAQPTTDNQAPETVRKETPATDSAPSNRSSSATDHGLSKPSNRSSNTDSELDEFASQLAEARRRVRERLTSYAESDSSRATSPVRQPELPSNKGSQSSLNPLGISILKAKSSSSSLVDRSRNTSGSQSKSSLKLLGLGGTMSSSRSPTKDSFDEKETSVQAIPEKSKARQARYSSETENDNSVQSANDKEDTSNAHPGLMAFRNAKRELQKRKELEALAQQQLSTTSQSPEESKNVEPLALQSPPPRAPGRGQTPSRDRNVHPMQYSSRGPSPERGYGMHRNSPPTHMIPGSRERSDSEANRGRSTSQSRRLHHHMLQQDGQLAPESPRGPLRSPGLPGTNIKQSPIMPPQGYPNRGVPSPMPSPHVLDRSKSAGNLKAGRAEYGAYPGQPSSASPMPPSPYTAGPAGSPAGTPTFGPRSRQPPASQPPSETAKRFVDKREISEPTFVMATSRMPTMDLPHGSGQEGGSRPSSRAGVPPVPTTAPPVPPINPRRRRESPRDNAEGAAGLGMPRRPFANQTESMVGSDAETQSAFSVSDDEEAGKSDHRRRLRKPQLESTGRVGRALANMRENSSTFSLNKSSHSTNSPSGMF